MICWLILILSLGLTVDDVSADYCGQRTVLNQELVHYGSQSRPGEWPWHVGLFHRIDEAAPSYACGGTIITENFILTAAHCVYPPTKVRPLNPGEVEIRAGIANIQRLEHSLQQKTVLDIIRHEDYNTGTSESDIALLKLDGKLKFTIFVKPVCLWKDSEAEELIVGKNGYVVGWGLDENNTRPDDLKSAIMPIVPRKDCAKSDSKYYTRYLFDRQALCAGFRNGTSVGSGDSGGGLYIEHKNGWMLRGITSKGKMTRVDSVARLDTKQYVIFTDVAHFMPWIRKKMGLPQMEEIVPSVVNYATCGNKKELQFRQPGHKEGRVWPWEGHISRSGYVNPVLHQVAILNENFVLAQGHIYREEDIQDPSRISIVFQSFEQGVEQTLMQRNVRRIVRFPDHSMALLELTVPLKFSEYIKPICLWKTDSPWSMISDAVGYSGEIQLRLQDYNTCLENHQINRTVFSNHSFCSVSIYGSRPVYPNFVYINYDGTWYLRGMLNKIVSSPRYLFLFRDVANYNNWIENNAVVESNNLLDVSVQECSGSTQYFNVFQLWRNNKLHCYASLIAPVFLLTAASCVDDATVDSITLFNHATRYTRFDDVYRIHLYPSFNRTQLSNNIAIIQLSEPATEKPFCLPRQLSLLPNQQLKILSWHTKSAKSTFHTSTVIRTNVESCAKKWRRESAQMMTNGGHNCAYMVGAEDMDAFDCRANLHGAPLVYESENKTHQFLVGILHIGKSNHCDGSDLPEVYTDVMFYAEWISDIVSFGLSKTTASKSLLPKVKPSWGDWWRKTIG